MSFSIASILSTTPRSNRLKYRRSLKYPFPTCQLVWHRSPRRLRWSVTHRSPSVIAKSRPTVGKASSSCLLHVKTARRCLDGQFQQSNEQPILGPGIHMVATDTRVCQPGHNIGVEESFLGRLTELAKNDFPTLIVHHHIVRMSEEEAMCWLEVTSPVIHIDSVLGPCNTVRLVVSQNGVYLTQVLFPFIQSLAQGKFVLYIL